MNPQMNPILRSAEDRLMVARKCYADAVAEVQMACEHKTAVGEIEEYRSSGSRLYRLCLHCGLSEDKRGGGYTILGVQLVYKLNANEYGKLRRGLQITHTHLDSIAEGETSLARLIREHAHSRHWAGDTTL